MTRKTLLAGSAILTLALSAQALLAQKALTGIESIDDRIDDIDRDVRTDLDRSGDDFRCGSPEYRDGLSGSASLSYVGKTGATDSSEFSLGARLRSASGVFVQNIGVAMDFTESGSVKTKENVFAIYEGLYYFNDSRAERSENRLGISLV